MQELIPGGGSQQFSYCAFFRDGEAVGKMVVRRRRQHPLEFGRASTYVESVDIPILEELSERFLRAIDYYGLVELEYKLDPRDSQYKLLDVNARTWGYHSLGARAGVDFSYMLYADQVGLPVPVSKRPRRIVMGAHDYRFSGGDGGHSSVVIPIGRAISARSETAMWKQCSVPSDPLPGLAEVALIPYLAIKRGF